MWRIHDLVPVLLIAGAGLTFVAISRGQADWHPVPSLHARWGHCMARDLDRDRIVMFGGESPGIWMQTGETWEWTGSEWLPREVPGPAPRHGAAMAWCPQRREVLLFGGIHQDVHGSWPQTYYGDTWSWNGQRWQQLRPTHAPGPRSHAAMAMDPVRGEIVLFGGYLPGAGPFGARSDETWVWDGTDWTQRGPGTAPIGRSGATLLQSPNSARLLMIGGMASGGWPADGRELWEWSGTNWSRLPAPAGPYPMGIPNAVYDPLARRILVVEDDYSYRQTKMWSWDGVRWLEIIPTSTHFRDWPPYLGQGRLLIHEPSRQRVLAFGGGTFQPSSNGERTPLRATWAFDLVSRRWSIDQEYPWVMNGQHGVVHDANRGRTLFVGHGETWTYEGEQFRKLPVSSPPHIGFAGILQCHYASGLVVLHGSHGDHLGRRDERTWLFDGSQWTSRLYTPRPRGSLAVYQSAYDPGGERILAVDTELDELWSFEPISGWQVIDSIPAGVAGMAAFDAARRRLVLVDWYNDRIWEWSGANWMQISHATSLPSGPGFAQYVPELGGIVLQRTRQFYNTQYNDGGTWLWDGIDWRRISSTKLPSKVGAGDIQQLFYDPERGRLVASYDGMHVPFFEFFDAVLSADPMYPRPGQTSRFTFRDVGQAGRAWFLGLSLSSDTGIPLIPHPFGVMRRFPLDADFVLAATLGNLRGTLDVRGEDSIALPIPNDQSLLGLRLHAAALTYGASSFSTISNVLELEVVR